MKTAGIITIHYVDNYGGTLLTYALQEVVHRLGYDSRVIDFDPTPLPSRVGHLSKVLGRRLARMPLYVHYFPHYLKLFVRQGLALPPRHGHRSTGLRKGNFDRFREQYINLSENHYTSTEAIQNSPPKYDAFICGSDQIWNPYICKSNGQARNEPAYFLKFAPESKRISYAPSIAIPVIPKQLREEMTSLLNGIAYLSVREKQGADLIKKMTGKDAEIVLDPTLLLDHKQWDQIAVEPDMKEPYILAYYLGKPGKEGKYRQFSQKLSEETGYRLVLISAKADEREKLVAISKYDVGPAEFVGLIKHASCVCTDSFHGTIFSINYKRPFYVFERPGSSGETSMATRIYSILEMLGLTARLMRPDASPPSDSFVLDYSKADVILSKERENSIRYIRESLEAVTRD